MSDFDKVKSEAVAVGAELNAPARSFLASLVATTMAHKLFVGGVAVALVAVYLVFLR